MTETALPAMCWICRTRPADSASATNPTQAFNNALCPSCKSTTHPYDEAWRALSNHLRQHWAETVRRGHFDLTKVFPVDTAGAATRVQLYFVKALGCKMAADKIDVALDSFSSALQSGCPHADINLLLADSTVPSGRFLSYDPTVSVLRDGDSILSAVWMHLTHPVAVKVCFMKDKAPIRPPPNSHPWHPAKQRKIVKLSPYKGDVETLVARRDLRI